LLPEITLRLLWTFHFVPLARCSLFTAAAEKHQNIFTRMAIATTNSAPKKITTTFTRLSVRRAIATNRSAAFSILCS